MTALHPTGGQQLSFPAYRALPGINWSSLKNLARCPAYFHWALTESPADTDAKKRGRAVHVAVYEPERFASLYEVWDGRRAGKDWEKFLEAATAAGREVLTAKEYELVKAVALAVRSHPMAIRYVSGVQAEQTVRWTVERPEVDGVQGWRFDAKGRLDALRPGHFISDLKSTKDASPSGFAREVVRLEHHVQAAWYVDGVAAATGQELPFYWVAVEAQAPHLVQVYRCPEDVLQLGRERYRELLDLLALCRRENRWPGYAETEMDLVLPRWAQPEEEEGIEDLGLVLE